MPKSVGDVIAERIRRFRKAKEMTIVQLAAECAAQGAPGLTAASLTNLERPSGGIRPRRQVAIEELLTLANVLQVPPLSIVLPIGEDVQVEIVPGRTVGVSEALIWLTGETSVGLDGKNPADLSAWYALARLREHILASRDAASEAYKAAAFGTTPPDGHRMRLDWVREAQVQHGEAAPPLPAVLERPAPGGGQDG